MSAANAKDGIVVNIFDESFTIPNNCRFLARPSIIGEEIVFKCEYWSPIDPVTVYFYKKPFCEKEIIKKYKISKSQSYKENYDNIKDLRYIEWKTSDEKSQITLNNRLILNNEVCLYAIGVYATHLDQVLNTIWKQ